MSSSSTLETRGFQAFPTLSAAEIERLRAFGSTRRFAAGEPVMRAGEVGHGLFVILSGEVRVLTPGPRTPELIVEHRAGHFMGELAQLSGRPALVDAVAAGPVEALAISPERLRAVLVAEAELASASCGR